MNQNSDDRRYGHADIAWSLLLRKEYPGWLYSVSRGATTWEHRDGTWNSFLFRNRHKTRRFPGKAGMNRRVLFSFQSYSSSVQVSRQSRMPFSPSKRKGSQT